MNRKELGKIEKISFGYGGYQDAMIGVSFTLSGVGWGVCDFWGNWALERSEDCRWTEIDRIKSLGEVAMRINELFKDAKVHSLEELKGKPIEAEFDNTRTLVSWRILKEVL